MQVVKPFDVFSVNRRTPDPAARPHALCDLAKGDPVTPIS